MFCCLFFFFSPRDRSYVLARVFKKEHSDQDACAWKECTRFVQWMR